MTERVCVTEAYARTIIAATVAPAILRSFEPFDGALFTSKDPYAVIVRGAAEGA
jgi:hypothetical protein